MKMNKNVKDRNSSAIPVLLVSCDGEHYDNNGKFKCIHLFTSAITFYVMYEYLGSLTPCNTATLFATLDFFILLLWASIIHFFSWGSITFLLLFCWALPFALSSAPSWTVILASLSSSIFAWCCACLASWKADQNIAEQYRSTWGDPTDERLKLQQVFNIQVSSNW